HVTSAYATGPNANKQAVIIGLRLLHVDDVKLLVVRKNERLHESSLWHGQQSKNRGTGLTNGRTSSRGAFSIASVANYDISASVAPQRGMRYPSTEIQNASAYRERSYKVVVVEFCLSRDGNQLPQSPDAFGDGAGAASAVSYLGYQLFANRLRLHVGLH